MSPQDRSRMAREAEALGKFQAAALLRTEGSNSTVVPDSVLALEAECRELEAMGLWAEALVLRATASLAY